MTEEKNLSATLDAASEEINASETEVTTNEMDNIIFDPTQPIVTLAKLLEGGVHYGHQTRKWNPKMKQYIHCARNGIYIIDLNKSKVGIESAYDKLKTIILEGGKALFVGTKDNSKLIVKEEAERSGSFYINNRWLGGILTNFKTIQTRIKKLKELEQAEEEGVFDQLPKKEAAALRKEKEKLAKNLEGIKEMRKIPNAIIVVDPMEEHNAVAEARILNIPVFAICDTNCNPEGVDFIIPGNDDATKSVKLIIGLLSDAVVEAKGGLPLIAYTKDEGEEVTMKDAIRQADRENALRLAARREMQRLRMEKDKARYGNNRFGNRPRYENNRNEEAPKAPVAPTAPVVEAPVSEKVEVAEVKKPAKKPSVKKVEEKTEEKGE